MSHEMTFPEWWATVHTEVTERMVGEELAEFVWLALHKRIEELEEQVRPKWLKTPTGYKPKLYLRG